MKKFILILLLFTFSCSSQNGTLVKDTITNCYLRYSYYPNYPAYYDAEKEMYLLKNNDDTWNWVTELPKMGYSVYNNLHFLIKDYDADNIIKYYKIHKKRWPYINSKNSTKILSEIRNQEK